MSRFFSNEYNHKALKKYLLLSLLTIAAFKLSMGILAAVIIPVCVIMALTTGKVVDLLFWVLFITFTSCGNRQIFSTNIITVLSVRVMLVTLSVVTMSKLTGVRHARAMSPFWGIVPYLVWEMLSSAQGFQPIISYLKLILFIIVFMALFGVANTVNASTRANAKAMRSAILAVLIVVIFGSVAVIPFPSISLMIGKGNIDKMLAGEITSLFAGMTSHSQVMGPLAGVLGTVLFADLVFSIKKFDLLYVGLLLCCPVLVYKSSSRTGMGVMLAGMMIVTYLALKARGLGARWKSRVITTIFIGGFLAIVAGMAVPSVREGAVRFVLKWGDTDARAISFDEVVKTRQGKIETAMHNFKKKPMIGNGFQVSEEMAHDKYNGIGDYLSAPIEKGIWIYAILEEGGVVGWILFTGWLIVLFISLIKRHAYIGCSIMFVFVIANLGEFCMFSTTYVGGFYWALIFACICLDVQRMKGQNIQVFEVPLDVVIAEEGIDMYTRRLA